MHVVDRSSDGVVIRGAKLHITGASLGHELMTIPTKAMKSGEDDYAIAAMVPVNSPGVKIVNTTYAPRHADLRDFPVSGKDHYPEGFVIFDDVFVPNERIFLDGEVAHAAVFAHSLGLWERLGGLSAMADGADVMVGLAQLIAEANGLGRRGAHQGEDLRDDHPRHRGARLPRSGDVARPGRRVRRRLPRRALHQRRQVHRRRHLQPDGPPPARHRRRLGGHRALDRRSGEPRDRPPGPQVHVHEAGVDGEYRTKLFHAIRDLTADSYGGWQLVTNIQAGGGLYAQRIVTRKHYDLDGAKRAALAVAGLTEDEQP